MVALAREDRALGKQQREQRQALLALGAVGTQLATVAQERELVAVGAVGGETTLEVARQARGELREELLGIRGLRARAVLEARLAATPAGRRVRRTVARASR